MQQTDEKLAKRFERLHKKLEETFATEENKINCIKCGRISETVICPYCYAKEVFFWLVKKNPSLAEKFSKTFNYDFMSVGLRDTIKTRNLMPIIICDERERSDTSICDSCGEPSDNLKKVNDQWLCEDCREE